ncbi:MAG TPA: hypothetical protein VLI94_03980 [Solirubrobacterales bacterium]|nr:hypothetical protein [Solirubrobacterales bacterium]
MRKVRAIAPAVIALALLALLFSASIAPAASGQVRVQADVSYHENSEGSINGVRLQIYRDGFKVLDRAPARPCPSCELVPVPPSYQAPARVVQLDGTPEPEVVFTLHSGGAHCCIFAQVFRWDETAGRYLLTVHDFQDFGYRLKDLRNGGRPLFAGSDSRLAYRFSCFACTIYPPRIWKYSDGRFIDVTPAYPGEVRKHLARTNRFYRRARGDGDVRGILATLVADKCLLGRCASGFKVVRRAIRSGFVRRRDRYEIGPHGDRYLRELDRFLSRLGYA